MFSLSFNMCKMVLSILISNGMGSEGQVSCTLLDVYTILRWMHVLPVPYYLYLH